MGEFVNSAGKTDTATSVFDYDGVARAAASSPGYMSARVPQEVREGLDDTLYNVSFVSPKIKGFVRAEVPQGTNVDALLNDAWSAALEHEALRYFEGKVIFPLPVMRADGVTPIEVSLARNDRYADSLPWFASYVDTIVREVVPRTVSPSRAIEDFAYLGYWEEFLGDLATLALPELWDFNPDGAPAPSRRYPILKSYIANIYYRLMKENKICVSPDGSFAAFNSGLVDKRYDDIYVCFEPNAPASRTPWRFAGFCTQGVGRLGKQIVNLFNPLPPTATFFDRKEDLLYDPDIEPVINYDHVLIDNIDRLPVEFIKEGMRTDDEALALLDKVRTTEDYRVRGDIYDQVRERLQGNPTAFRYLRGRLNDAVDLARKRVRWNYKTAIPMYYPRANAMSLLLPLCLMDDSVADAALVMELMDSGNYQGQTVLTMRMAYQDARLVCRPDSDWLTTSSRSECEMEE